MLALQADGSGMYTVQALWTQARENLDVVTVIFANRAYAILQGEMRNVGVNASAATPTACCSLDDPALDWVALAKRHGRRGGQRRHGRGLRPCSGPRWRGAGRS